MPDPKLNLRLPPDLREEAAMVAEALGVSLNAFIVQAVRSWTGYQAKQVLAYRQTLRGPAPVPAPAQVPRVGPNQPCPCGSGDKYKRCHGRP